MNDDTSQRRRPGRPRRAAMLAAAAGIALLTAACGGGSSGGGSGGSSASPGSSSASPGDSSTAGGQAAQPKQFAWSQCMRSHGVDVPISAPSPVPSGSTTATRLSGPVVNPNSPQYQAAQHACQPLQPGGTRAGG